MPGLSRSTRSVVVRSEPPAGQIGLRAGLATVRLIPATIACLMSGFLSVDSTPGGRWQITIGSAARADLHTCVHVKGSAGVETLTCQWFNNGALKDRCDQYCPQGPGSVNSWTKAVGYQMDLSAHNGRVKGDEWKLFLDEAISAAASLYPASWAQLSERQKTSITSSLRNDDGLRAKMRGIFTVRNAQRTETRSAEQLDAAYKETCFGMPSLKKHKFADFVPVSSAYDQLNENLPGHWKIPAYLALPATPLAYKDANVPDGLIGPDAGRLNATLRAAAKTGDALALLKKAAWEFRRNKTAAGFGVTYPTVQSACDKAGQQHSGDPQCMLNAKCHRDTWCKDIGHGNTCSATRVYKGQSQAADGCSSSPNVAPGPLYCHGSDWGKAYADLAVTGRRAYASFLTLAKKYTSGGSDLAFNGIKAELEKYLNEHPDNGDANCPKSVQISDASAAAFAVDRAFTVANVIQNGWQKDEKSPPLTQFDVRKALRYIATSGEDDMPRRPVNVPSAIYRQYEQAVSVPLRWKTQNGATPTANLSLRYYFIDGENKPSDGVFKNHQLPETPEIDPAMLDGKEVIIFLHGLGSRAEEADALGDALQRRGSKYVILTLDLPDQGYSTRFDPSTVGPLSLSGSLKHFKANACIPVPPPGGGCIPVSKDFEGFDSNGRHRAPMLDFTEDAVVAFVDALDAKMTKMGAGPRALKKRIKGVAGGSLGGNLALRLGRRHLDWGAGSTASTQWGENERVVAWSPASVWESQASSALLSLVALTTSFNNASHANEEARDRYGFIDAKFFKPVSDPLPIIPPGPATWYRWDWPCLGATWLSDVLSVQETYDRFYRRTIKRLEFEQLLYSHASDPEMIPREAWHPGQNQPLAPSLPFRPMSFNFVPTVLLAGGGDNFLFAEIYNNTKKRAAEINVPGRLLLLGSPGPATDNNLDPLKSTAGPSAADPTESTGHSIASERPNLLAYVIDKNFGDSYVASPP